MKYQQFYSELGKLLYAVADIDGVISKKEKKELQDLVRIELAPVENSKDQFGTDAAYYALFEFDILEDAMLEPEAAFESFIDFIEEHKTAIDKNMILAIRKVTGKLAEAYRHTNKKERKLLNKLNEKLDAVFVWEKVG